jgi:hypothetical protein
MLKRKDYRVFVIAVLSVIGIVSLLFATTWGIGISPDSNTYISVARNLLDGHGLTQTSANGTIVPMTHYPPLYPMLLAMIGIFGIDLLDGARYLNAFLFGANIIIVGLVISRSLRGSVWTSIFGSFLVLTSGVMITIHSMAWTEPLFVFFGLLGLFLLALYIENPKPLLLITCSGAISLAFLARYPGAALVATGIVAIFFMSRKTCYGRIGDSVIFVAISSIPMALWIIRNSYIADSATNREIVFHAITFAHITSALSTFSRWLLPSAVPDIIRTILFIMLAVGLLGLNVLLLQNKRRLNKSDSTKQYLTKLPCILVTFIFFYGALLVASISFFDAQTPLTDRILSPVYVSGLILILSIAHKLLRSMEGIRVIQVASIVLCIVFAGSYLLRGTSRIIRAHSDGQGYAGNAWKQSEIIQKVRVLPSELRVYTNAPDAVYFLSGKPAYGIPNKLRATTRVINKNYLSQLTSMGKQLKNHDAVLVYFNTITWRWYLPSEDELKEKLPLRVLFQGADGTIYKAETTTNE